jgi:uncharacterized protein
MTAIVNFTPIASLAGGALIGLAAVGLMATLGRIAGLTGIVRGVIPPWSEGQEGWRLAFLVGAVLAPSALFFAHYWPIGFSVPAPAWSLPLSGALVGIGVTYSNGCPSGHGVCGLARFSPRSAVAVATFMATAAATVFIVRHVIGV